MSTPEQPQYLSACPACEGILDVTAFEPYSKVVCPTCGQTVRVRRKFDHFIIVRQIGEGGMSRVFESEDQLLGRRAALKILNRHFSRDGVRMAQFEREAQLTAAVTHPNVVKVYSVGRDQGNFYIAMELVSGGSLEQRILERQRLDEREVLRLGLAVADGLRAAYREGLIHRDVKPANILFTEENTPKIVDFGLALFHERDVDESGEIWATPYYVAPEKVIHDQEDFRSDMFSLGATLYHALTGKPPHKANTNSLTELKVIKSRTVRLAESGLKFSPRTCQLVDRLLAMRPENRYQSYDELVEAFRDAESILGYSIRGQRSRRRKMTYAIAAGVAGLIALLAMIPKSGGYKGQSVTVTTNGGANAELSELGKTLASGAKSVSEVFRSAREALVEGRISEAWRIFDELNKSDVTKPYTRNLSRFNSAICAIVSGKREEAVRYFKAIRKQADEDVDVGGEEMRKFFSHIGGNMARDLALDKDRPKSLQNYRTDNEEALAYLVHGLAHWHFGDARLGGEWIETFNQCEPGKGYEWVSTYKKLAAPYLEDIKIIRSHELPQQTSFTRLKDAQEFLKNNESVLSSLKTQGSYHSSLASAIRQVKDDVSRLRREEQVRLAEMQKETRERELSQVTDLLGGLPSLAHGYDFSKVIEVLKESRFESPEVQGMVANKLYLWTRAQEFVDVLMSDVNSKGYLGTVARRSGSPLQGRLVKMDKTKATLALSRGEISFPTDTLAPDALVQIAQAFCATVRDSADYYRRQELIAVFAKLQGLEHMAQTVAAQLMEENRSFRKRWTLVEQSGS